MNKFRLVKWAGFSLAALYLCLLVSPAEPQREHNTAERARARAEALLDLLREGRWNDAARFCVAVTGQHDRTTRKRLGIPDDADGSVVLAKAAEWFKGLYDEKNSRPRGVQSVRIDPNDQTLAHVNYRSWDLDAFSLRLVDGEWYYTLDD